MFAGDWADFCKSGHILHRVFVVLHSALFLTTELRVNMCAQIAELGKMVA